MTASEDDFDLEGYADRFAADVDAGDIPVPGPGAGEFRQGCWFTLTATEDPAAVNPEGFAAGGPLGVMEPGAVLAAVAGVAAVDPAALGNLSLDAVLGLAGAGRRMAARGAAVQQRAVAEYARRMRQPDPRKAGKAGYALFAQDDLAPELMVNSSQAEDQMTRCEAAGRRLVVCCGLLWDGRISEYHLKIMVDYTACLTDEGAAEADQILACAAPDLTPGQLRAMAARVVMMIDPEAARDRRSEAAKKARIEKFQEVAGTAALSGRDLPTQAVLRSWQHIDSRARALRAAGAAGSLDKLRVAVYLALTSGTDPLTLLPEITEDPREWDETPACAPDGGGTGDRWPWTEPDEAETGDQDPQDDHDPVDDREGGDEGPAGGARRGPQEPRGPRGPRGGAGGGLGGQDAPFEAAITLVVPAGTLFGWSSAPGEIPGYGPVDPETAQDLAQTASAHPKTRWCLTVIDPVTGEATAHGCAPGQHRWHPSLYRTGGGDRDGPGQPRDRPDQPRPDPGTEPDQRAAGQFLASLRVELAPVAAGATRCDHRECTEKYEVPRTLKHLVRARRATCAAPCCNRPAADGDADHTVPWPQGPTCQENLSGLCRYHHRCKQDPEWTLEQPEPGIITWRGPSGRTRTTRPGRYLI